MDNQYKYIDLTYLKETAGDMNEVILEFITIFKEQLPDLKEGSENAYNEKDWLELSRAAHKAKASIFIMGMVPLSEELKKLEILAKEGKNTEYYKSVIDQFNHVTALGVEELNEIAKTLQALS